MCTKHNVPLWNMSQIDDEMADEQEEMLQDSSGDGSSDEDDDDMNDQREGELRMKVEEIRKQVGWESTLLGDQLI